MLVVDNSGDLEWLPRLSRSVLTVPNEKWLRQLRELNVLFCVIREPSSMGRKSGVILCFAFGMLVKFPDLNQKIARKYAVTRTHMRVRCANYVRIRVEMTSALHNLCLRRCDFVQSV